MIIIDGGWVQSILHLFSCMSEIWKLFKAPYFTLWIPSTDQSHRTDREGMREMRGEGLSLLSYNTAKQLINCIPHQVSLESYGHLVQSPAPGRRPVVSWPHGLPSQGHSVSPGWNTNVQMEAVLSTNNVITRSSLLVNNSLKKKKVRFKATARTCLNNAFS